jgi:hypothetical protein
MKRILLCLSLALAGYAGFSQSPFWTENFGSGPGCSTLTPAAYSGTNGAWTVSNTGTNDFIANEWYVSAREAGMGVNICGDGCVTNTVLINRTLHVSTSQTLLGDIGAAYSAGPGFSNTNKRAESPSINCSGQSNIVLRFNYIMWGVINQDFTQVMYSPDNGTTWTGLGIPPQTPTVACSGQGIWTSYSVALPATANNNSTVKIGFRWQNVSSSGADPSFAVDDITLTAGSVVAPTLTATFSLSPSVCQNGSVSVTANTGTFAISGYTWSAIPSGLVFASPNASATAITFPNAGTYSITLTATSGTQVASSTNTIQVIASPALTVSASNSSICSGGSSTLTVSGALSYTWQPGNTNGSSVVVNPTSTTIYTVSGTATLGCTSSSTTQVAVNALPTISISATNTTVCIGTIESLTASGAVSYTWLPANTNGSTTVISPTANTVYTVNGTSSAGCNGTQTIAITAISCTNTSIQTNFQAGLNIEVYPNPVNEMLEIKIPFNGKTTKVEVRDLNGKRVYLNEAKGILHQINVSEWATGVYIVTCEADGKIIGDKIKVIKN